MEISIRGYGSKGNNEKGFSPSEDERVEVGGSYQLSVISYQLPVTSYHLPVIGYRLSVIGGQ